MDDRLVSTKHGSLYPLNTEVRDKMYRQTDKQVLIYLLPTQLNAVQKVWEDVEKALKLVSDDLLLEKSQG